MQSMKYLLRGVMLSSDKSLDNDIEYCFRWATRIIVVGSVLEVVLRNKESSMKTKSK